MAIPHHCTMNNFLKHTPWYHLLFWIFIFFYVFDYFYAADELLSTAVTKTVTECFIYATICYMNLFILIPRYLERHNAIYYTGSLIIFLGLLFVPYFYSGLIDYLMSESTLRNAFSFGLNYTLFIFISYLYWVLIRFYKEKHQLILLKNEKLDTELQLLKSQISPHFLFNSLNNIYSLALTKSDRAPEMIEKLSTILRYLLEEGQQTQVALEKEAALLEQYIDLQRLKKVKAEKHISYEVTGVLPQHKIQPLLLINFVENAFKHSDIQYNENGYLKVTIDVDSEDQLLFTVSNSTDKKRASTGIGLGNVQKQLEAYFGSNFQLDIADEVPHFKITLKLPTHGNTI